MWVWALFAQVEEKGDPLRRPEMIIAIFALAAVLLLGAGVIYWVDKWRKRASTTATEGEEVGALTDYRDMYEHGEITEAEYAELRRRVAEKIKNPATATPGPTAPAQSGERATVNPPVPPTRPTEPPPPT
ncbi:MAG: hypothetical protein L0241_14810 [Planctomycetia bacterium]|nr:hypothetical protein [Planctomycetia bacterium]